MKQITKEDGTTYYVSNTGVEVTVDDYATLTVDQKRADGFLHDPEVVYEKVISTTKKFGAEGNEQQYTMDATDGTNKVLVSTSYYGCTEDHTNYDGVEPTA